jgi:Putative Ig domain/SdrD B-like domain
MWEGASAAGPNKNLFFPYQPNTRIVRCAARSSCWPNGGGGMLEGNAVTLTPPNCANSPITLTPSLLPPAIPGQWYEVLLTAGGGIGGPYMVSVTGGLLPGGLELSALSATEWQLSGYPTAIGSFHFTLTVTDATLYCSQGFPRTIEVNCESPIFNIQWAMTPNSCSNNGTPQNNTDDFVLGSVTVSYTWPPNAGDLTLSGSFLHPSNQGATTVAGSSLQGPMYTFTGLRLRATGVSAFLTAAFSAPYCPVKRLFTAPPPCSACPALTLTPGDLPEFIVGETVDVPFTINGGTPGYVFQTTGTLPPGLLWIQTSPTTAVLTGVATMPGNFFFTVQVTDALGCPASGGYAARVCPKIDIQPATLPAMELGVPYSVQLTAGGGVAPYQWAALSLLPPGLGLNATTGLLSGTPVLPGTFTFTVQVTDTNQGVSRLSCHGERTWTAVVCDALKISPSTLPLALLGQSYSVALNVVGGVPLFTWSVSAGQLPSGLTLNPATGVISGTPLSAGAFSVGLHVVDGQGCAGEITLTLHVCGIIGIGPIHVGSLVVDQPYSLTLVAAGGVPAYVYSIGSGALPNGLILNSLTGVISGTPTTAGSFSFAITAVDSQGCKGSRVYAGAVAPPPLCGLGNVVFIDTDGDGRFDPGEGRDGVRLDLFSATGTYLASTVTTGGGCYLFANLQPGSYFVKIPETQFVGAGVLAGYVSWPGQGGDTLVDDTADENGIDDPAYLTVGIRSAVIALAVDTEPTAATGEQGKDSNSDNADDDNTDLTIDFGFRKPATYCEFILANGLTGAEALPAGNPDGDLYPNAQEFLFGYPATSGLNPACPLSVTLNGDQTLDICLRGLQGLQGVTYALDGTASLTPTAWINVGATVAPTLTHFPDGTFSLCWQNVELAPGLGAGQGFFRGKITLDTDCNGTQDFITVTQVIGFQDRRINTQCETFSNPFLKCELFSGLVDGNTVSTLNVATAAGGANVKAAMNAIKAYYVEILSGPQEGHRFEIDPAASTATTLAIKTSTPLTTRALTVGLLTGATFAVREFWQMAEQFPVTLYQQGTNQGNADYALFYENGQWQSYYLSTLNGGRWLKVGGGSGSQNGKVIDPARGLYIHRQDGPNKTERPIDLVLSGWVRDTKFACPTSVGTNFVAGGWPIHQSPTQRAVLITDGYTGGVNQLQADKIYRWEADATWTWPVTSEFYKSFWLLNVNPTLRYWTLAGQASLPNKDTDTTLFLSGHCVFMHLKADHSLYVMPRAWVP